MSSLQPVIRADSITVTFRPYYERVPTLKRAFSTLQHKERKEVVALRDVSLTVNKGDSLAVIGANGAGKSTLLRTLAGSITPEAGSVTHFGASPTLLELGVGFNKKLSGRANVYLGGLAAGRSKSDIDSMFDGIADFAELGEAIERPVNTYSSGMKARLAFAIASTMNPEILMLDEIFAVGDASFKARSSKVMEELLEGTHTIVMVSHGMGRLRRHCERAIWLDRGQIVMDGETGEVIDAYLEKTTPRTIDDAPDTSGEWTGQSRAAVVRRALAGESLADLAEEHGLSRAEIRNWKQRYTTAGQKSLRDSELLSGGLDDEDDDDVDI